MSDRIKLYYSNDSHRGPGAVVQNLRRGLESIGAELVDDNPDYEGYLQRVPQRPVSPETTLYGPNLVVLPTEAPELYRNTVSVVPSDWVKSLYERYDFVNPDNVHVWSVGIDTDKWAQLAIEKTQDCLVYSKGRSARDELLVEKILTKNKLSYQILRYGSYQEQQLERACDRSRFAVLLTGTESQGIAYMQILSKNLPCYVFNSNTWKSEDKTVAVPATSVPYFDSTCGEVTDDIDLEHFAAFVEKAKTRKYTPRKYILKNHTLQASAHRYLELLKLAKEGAK